METSMRIDTPGDVGSEKNLFQCFSCKISFKTADDLLKHNMRSHKKRKFFCTNCGKSFMYESSLICHIDKCNVNEQFPCPACGQIFSSLKKLNEHDKKHKNKDVICDICSEILKREDLDLHTELHKGRRYIECDFCETICLDEVFLQKHLVTHNKEKQDVPKSTTEEGEKPSASHLKEKPPKRNRIYQCSTCRKKCSTQYNLDLHLKLRHKFTLQKCPETHKMMLKPSAETLKKTGHAQQPTEGLKGKDGVQQKVYKCTSCRKKFCSQNQLRNHKKTCVKIKYRCPKCQKGYSSKKRLLNHVCSKNNSYKCNVCDEAFEFKEDLFKHFFVHKSLQGMDLFI